MSEKATVQVTQDVIGDVSPYIFGALTEHFGYGMYGGIWDTQRDIPREDVKAAAGALGATMFRYPGGCFSDWYHWRDGVGPKDRRPVHDRQYWTGFRFDELMPEAVRDLFYLPERLSHDFGPRETNQVGTDEFLQYCLDLDVEPMLVANFGSGSPEEAAAWVAHTNRGSAPRPVQWWSVGNETYGTWEIGHCPPADYAKGYREYVEAMRAVDPTIKMVGVGCGAAHPDGRAWNRTLVEQAGDVLDALSVHWYFPGPWLGRKLRDDEGDYLQIAAGSDSLGDMLDQVMAQIDPLTDQPIPLSLDEWNFWFEHVDLLTTTHRQSEGVFFAGCFNRMIERADRVRVAAISHLVNCMAPIQTRDDRHFVTSSYLIMRLYRRFTRRDAVRVEVESSGFSAPAFADTAVEPSEIELTEADSAGEREARSVDASATVDGSGTTVFLANRLLDRAQRVTVTGLPAGASGRLRLLVGDGPFARNSVDDPSALGFRDMVVHTDDRGRTEVELPPHTAGALSVERA